MTFLGNQVKMRFTDKHRRLIDEPQLIADLSYRLRNRLRDHFQARLGERSLEAQERAFAVE